MKRAHKKKIMVTGAAGFIGSQLAERLVSDGYFVTGIDSFSDYYPRSKKEANLSKLRSSDGFQFVEGDILKRNLDGLLEGVSYIFHEAAQAGVRGSWGDSFEIYLHDNIYATQRLLEAVKTLKELKGFIFASSSSIYGDAERYPTSEEDPPKPVSPYGVTKLACEHLCRVYQKSFGVPITILRYFTVYGPRQRPDMAFYRFIDAMIRGKEFVVYGDGEQTRNFTYVSDIVEANILAMKDSASGGIFNIGGGSQISVNGVIGLLEDITGNKACVRYGSWQKGDARNTAADTARAREILGYRPEVSIEQGLAEQVRWQLETLGINKNRDHNR
jgi:UDP-glucose 4-epimerase